MGASKPKKSGKKPAQEKAETKKTAEMKKNELKVQKDLEEVNKLFSTFGFYPVAVDSIKKEEARAEIIKAYRKGKDYLQQGILHLIYENLVQYSEYNTAMNYNFFKVRNPNEQPAKLKFSVYRAMFNYTSSLEGAMDLISLLGEIGDLASAKLLTHLFNYYSGNESERFKMLRNMVITALGECNSTYALTSLLSYVGVVDSERLFNRITDSLMRWEPKLRALDIPYEEKKELQKLLSDFMKIVKSEGHSAYVR